MSFEAHLTTFAGLPVFAYPFDDEDDIAAGLAEPTPLPEDPGSVAWRLSGYLDYDDIVPFEEVLAGFLERVDSTRVRAIVLGAWDEAAYEGSPIGLVVEAAAWFPQLTAIFLGDIVREESDVAYIGQPQVTSVFEAFPGLTEFRVRGGAEGETVDRDPALLKPVTHAALRVLAFETGGLAKETIQAVGASELPALEHLEFYFGHPNYGADGTVEDLRWLLDGERLPNLRRLGLRDALIQDELAEAVAHAPVVAQLDVLDLSLGTLGDEGAAALLAGQPLTHLRKLDLHHHFLSEEMAARLVAALPGVEVDVSRRQKPHRFRDRNGIEQAHRYIAVSE